MIRYKLFVGQIGLFYIDKEYRNCGLGKQILDKVIMDMEDYGVEEVWAVTSKNHEFWSNVYKKSFTYKDPVHSTVRGSGYICKIKNLDHL
jgi:N-acetylglutamate synthase-like GNAT family acetyltransferase